MTQQRVAAWRNPGKFVPARTSDEPSEAGRRDRRMPFIAAAYMTIVIAATMILNDARVTLLSVAIIAAITMFYAITRLWVAVIWFVVYSAMEGFFKYTSGFSQMVYIVKPALCAFIFAAWMLQVQRVGGKVRLPTSSGMIFLMMFWGLGEMFNPYSGGIGQAITTHVVWYVVPALMFFVVYSVVKSKQEAEMLQNVMIAIGVVVALLAVLQFGMGRPWTETHTPGYSNLLKAEWFTIERNVKVASAFRPASTSPQGGGGSIWCYLSIVLTLTVLFTRELKPLARAGLLLVVLVDLLGLLVSGVRLWVVISLIDLILIVVLSGLSISRLGRTILALSLAALVIYAAAFIAESVSGGQLHYRYEATFNDPVAKFQNDRGGNFSYLPGFLAQRPLGIGFQRGLGGGLDRSDIGTSAVNRETQFNAIAADLGIPGLVLLVWITGKLLFDGWRVLRAARGGATESYALPFYVVFVGLVIGFLGGPIIQGGDFFWITAAAMLPWTYLRKIHSGRQATDLVGAGPPVTAR